MSPVEIAMLGDDQIIEIVTAAVSDGQIGSITGDTVFMAVCELRRRHLPAVDVPRTPSGRVRRASSIEIDPDRWRSAWYRRRINQLSLSEMLGKSNTWTHAVMRRGCASYFVLDQIAAELGETTDDLVWEVASDRERQRMSFV